MTVISLSLLASCGPAKSKKNNSSSAGDAGTASLGDLFNPGEVTGCDDSLNSGYCPPGIICFPRWTQTFNRAGQTSWRSSNNLDISGIPGTSPTTAENMRISALSTDVRLKIKVLIHSAPSTCYNSNGGVQNQNRNRIPAYGDVMKFTLKVRTTPTSDPFYDETHRIRVGGCTNAISMRLPTGTPPSSYYHVEFVPEGSNYACKYFNEAPNPDSNTDIYLQCPVEERIPQSVCYKAQLIISTDATYDFPN